MRRTQAGFTELFTCLVFLLRNQPSAQLTLYCWMVTVETEPGSPRKCTGEGQGATCTREKIGKSTYILGEVFSPWGWSNIGAGCSKVGGSLFLEILNHQLNMALSNLIQLDLRWVGVREETRRDFYQPLLSCHSLVNQKGHFWTRYLSPLLLLPASCISISSPTGCHRHQIHCTGWLSFHLSVRKHTAGPSNWLELGYKFTLKTSFILSNLEFYRTDWNLVLTKRRPGDGDSSDPWHRSCKGWATGKDEGSSVATIRVALASTEPRESHWLWWITSACPAHPF